MKNLVIAKRYAKALFNLAREEAKIDQYGNELAGLVRMFAEIGDLANAIQSPLYPEAARKAIFANLAERLGSSPTIKSFINLLIEKNRVLHLSDILDYYQRLIDEHANVARAQVSAAVALDDKILQDIAVALGTLTGKKVAVEFHQEPGLIGGVVARIGDLVLDGSVRTQLYNFKESQKRGELA